MVNASSYIYILYTVWQKKTLQGILILLNAQKSNKVEIKIVSYLYLNYFYDSNLIYINNTPLSRTLLYLHRLVNLTNFMLKQTVLLKKINKT